MSVDQTGPILHGAQSLAGLDAWRIVIVVDAQAVIGDLQQEMSVKGFPADVNRLGLSVPDGVVDRLLRDAKQMCRCRRIEVCHSLGILKDTDDGFRFPW